MVYGHIFSLWPIAEGLQMHSQMVSDCKGKSQEKYLLLRIAYIIKTEIFRILQGSCLGSSHSLSVFTSSNVVILLSLSKIMCGIVGNVKVNRPFMMSDVLSSRDNPKNLNKWIVKGFIRRPTWAPTFTPENKLRNFCKEKNCNNLNLTGTQKIQIITFKTNFLLNIRRISI